MLDTTYACNIADMELEDIGAKIAQARDAAGMNQSDLARAVGVTPQAVQKWEAGSSKPRFNRLVEIASAIGVELHELIRGTAYESALADTPIEPTPPELRRIISGGEYRSRHRSSMTRKPGQIPKISWVQAGDFSEAIDIYAAGYADEWMYCPFPHGAGSFVLEVVGESMYDPTGPKSYAPGDCIAVDPTREAVNRSMVVVKLTDDNKATFKQLIIDPDGTKMLRALNPNWPKPFIEINGNARIVGVVIGKWVPE